MDYEEAGLTVVFSHGTPEFSISCITELGVVIKRMRESYNSVSRAEALKAREIENHTEISVSQIRCSQSLVGITIARLSLSRELYAISVVDIPAQ